MSRSITEFQEGEIYLDTMLLYAFLRTEPKARPVIGPFFERIETGAVTAYTSVLTFMSHFSLRPRDALHLTAMRHAGCANLASNDHHFDAISDITRFAVVLP